MLPKVATQILHHTSRAAAVAQNQTSHTIRNVLQIQSSSGASSSSGALPTRNSPNSPGSSPNRGGSGAGPGGAKFNPGKRFQNSYTVAGRTIAQVNIATAHDSNSGETDDNDERSSRLVSLHTSGTRRRSHSLCLSVQTRHESAEKLAVLETVQLHARSRHAFAHSSTNDHLTWKASPSDLAVPLPPSTICHNADSVPPAPDSSDTMLPPPSTVPLPPPSSKTNLPIHQPSVPSKTSSETTECHSSTFDALKAARDSGDPTIAMTEVLRFRDSAVNSSVLEFNMAIEALCWTRRPGDSLTVILETYNDMLKRSLLPSIKTYLYLIEALTDRDDEVCKVISSLEARGRRRALSGRTKTAANTGDEQRMAQLRAESNLPLAMSLFETVISLKANGKISLATYHNLLRSCSYHSNVDAAIHVFAQLEKRSNVLPSAAVFGHLITVYTNVGDLQGAKEVFQEFKIASKAGRIGWASPLRLEDMNAAHPDFHRHVQARSSQLMVWNKMIEAYFRCGQPTGALSLLEQMMDTKADETFGPADIPPPASSTFTEIISGFCRLGDVQTALVWFDRLLQQKETGRHPYETSVVPHRPNQIAWNVMLNSLAFEGLVDDLNRLFTILLDNASRDGLNIRATDRILVFQANMNYLEAKSADNSATEKLDFVLNQVLLNNPPSAIALNPHESRNVIQTLVDHHLKCQLPANALTAVERYADQEIRTIREGETSGLLSAVDIHHKMNHIRMVVVTASMQLFAQKMELSFDEALRLMRLSDRLGLLPSRAVAPYYLRAYVAAKESNRGMTDLTMRDWELFAYGTTSLELPADENDTSNAPRAVIYGTTFLLQDLAKHDIDLTMMHQPIIQRIIKVLFLRHNVDELRAIFATLGSNYENILNNPQRDIRTQKLIENPEIIPNDAVSGLEQDSAPLRIDNYHSHFINEFFPHNSNVTPLMAYARYEAGLESNVYPTPATMGRLISALGRLGEIEKVRKLYDDAQRVLSSLERDKKWQSQAWFHIEDQMIIAYAHAGDLDSAHVHRERILAQGGAPTADSYGALIECVKDTTDDTSNALALFQESQRQGVPPNIYLYNNMISKLAKARKADFALELFQQMKASHVQPSSITYGAVIAACARVGDGYSAELLFTEMTQQRNYKPRIPPFNTMMQLYASTKPNRDRVLHYYNALLKANVRPTAHTYKLLIDTYGSIEPIDIDSMEQVFQNLEKDQHIHIQGSHWAAIINAWGCVNKNLDKAVAVFESIPSHPSTSRSPTILPDAVTFEALINAFVAHRRTDLIPQYIERLKSLGVHMTAYIANCLIKGYAAVGDLEQSRLVFESLLDPPQGVAAPNNHVPHHPSPYPAVPATFPVYREPSTWEAMVRAELGHGHRDRAIALLDRLQARKFPAGVYNRICGIMFDDPL